MSDKNLALMGYGDFMQANLKRVMELQPLWTHVKNTAMDERGKLVRHSGPDWLETFSEQIAREVGVPLEDLLLEGRDGTGPKTEVPWFRFSSESHSPSATIGWYCVYLFDTQGENAYLCLSHGSTDWEGGNFIPRPLDELRAHAEWARTVLAVKRLKRNDIIENIQLFSRRSGLGPAYEASTALAVKYPQNGIPDDAQLKDDVLFFASLLGDLYRREMQIPIPIGVPPEIQELDDAVAKAAGKKGRGGQGFRLNVAHRKAIELRAMDLAKLELESRGCVNIRNTSQGNPFDYQCSLDGDEIFVEVKGTTSSGEVVILTRGEVELHREKFPRNMLILVHGIQLTGESFDIATGGEVRVLSPWTISDDSLKVVAYNYTTNFVD